MILRRFYDVGPEKCQNCTRTFQMVISRVFWKLFELCQRLKYSSGSQLSDEYKNMGLRVIPYDSMMILRRSVEQKVDFARAQLTKSCTSPCQQGKNVDQSPQDPLWDHQEVPPLLTGPYLATIALTTAWPSNGPWLKSTFFSRLLSNRQNLGFSEAF